MKLEALKLWAEKDLLMDDGDTEQGFLGYFKGIFTDVDLSFAPVLFVPDSMELQSAFSMLIRYLQSEDAHGILQDKLRMETFCRDRLHDHIPYSFNRECFGIPDILQFFLFRSIAASAAASALFPEMLHG